VNRNRLIAGGAVGFLLILIIAGLTLLSRELRSGQAQVNQREPVQKLGYCDSRQIAPCIISFSRDSTGKMLINILTRGASFPDFYLKIKHTQGESIYPCTEVEKFATSVYCAGKVLPLGEALQFFMLSINDNQLLAQGNFSIIGMAFSTVEIFSPPTESPTASSTVPATDGASPIVTSTGATPTRTPIRTPTRTPSYPNPSTPAYPNPKP
jgi:hypothetical protein